MAGQGWNIFTDVLGAVEGNPSVNPYFGAHYFHPNDPDAPDAVKKSGKPAWADQDGNDITEQMNAYSPDLAKQKIYANTQYPNVGFLSRLTPEGQAAMAANRASQTYGGDQSQQRQAESLAYQNNTANMIGRSRTAQAMSPNDQAMFAGTGGFDPNAQASSLQNQADIAHNFYGLEGQAKANTAATIGAQNPQSADSDISQNAALQAQLAKEQTIENQKLQGWKFGAQQYDAQNVVPEQERAAYVNARYPGYGGPQYRIGDIGDPTSSTIGALSNPTSTPINMVTGAVLSGGGIGNAGALMGPGGGVANPTWTGSNASDSRQAGSSQLAGNYANLPAPANPPPVVQQSGGPSVPPFMPPAGSTMASRGTVDENQDNYLTAREKAAHDSALAKHKLIGAQVKASQAELEHQKQALIEARQQGLMGSVYKGIGAIGHGLKSIYDDNNAEALRTLRGPDGTLIDLRPIGNLINGQ